MTHLGFWVFFAIWGWLLMFWKRIQFHHVGIHSPLARTWRRHFCIPFRSDLKILRRWGYLNLAAWKYLTSPLDCISSLPTMSIHKILAATSPTLFFLFFCFFSFCSQRIFSVSPDQLCLVASCPEDSLRLWHQPPASTPRRGGARV